MIEKRNLKEAVTGAYRVTLICLVNSAFMFGFFTREAMLLFGSGYEEPETWQKWAVAGLLALLVVSLFISINMARHFFLNQILPGVRHMTGEIDETR